MRRQLRNLGLTVVRLFQEPPESIYPFVALNHELERRLVQKIADDTASLVQRRESRSEGWA